MRIATFIIFVLLAFCNISIYPYGYDALFCKVVFYETIFFSIIFVIHQSQQEGFFNFHTFFVITFLIINFAHSVFIYPDDSLYPSLYRFPYAKTFISKSVAIAQLGLSVYMLAAELCYKHKKKWIHNLNNSKIYSFRLFSFFIAFFLLVYVMLIEHKSGLEHMYPKLLVLLLAILCISLYLRKTTEKYNKNIIHCISKTNILDVCTLMLFISSQLIIGSRTEVLVIFFFYLGFYNRYIYRLKALLILNIFVCGILFFGIICMTRVSNVNLTNSSLMLVIKEGLNKMDGNIILLSLTDLIVNVRNLYDGIEYGETQNLMLGKSYIPYFFAPIPYLPSMITTILFDKVPSDLGSGALFTKLAGANYGLGSNCIGDIYLNYSTFGVVVIMLLLGIIVQKSKQSDNSYAQILYFSLFGYSIYIVRACFLCFVDFYFFAIIIYWIMTHNFYIVKPVQINQNNKPLQ